MRSVGMAQVVEPKISDARLPASRSKGMFDIPDVPAIPIAENIACLFRHLREDSVEGVVDREHTDRAVFGYGQDDEAAFQPHVIPLQP